MNDVGSIVEKVKTGDESALRSLYEIFSPMMKNVCAGIIRGGGGGNRETTWCKTLLYLPTTLSTSLKTTTNLAHGC